MKYIVAIVTFMLSAVFPLRAQQFYARPHVRYHTPVTFQQAPEYFDAAIIVSTNSGMYYTYVITKHQKFSLAKGISYGADFGIKTGSNISFELGTDYYQSRKEFISDSVYPYFPVGTTAWQLRTLNISPGIAFSEDFNNVSLSIRAAFITSVTSLGKSIIFEDKRKTYMFNTSLGFGYKFGIDAGYHLGKHFMVSAEAGIENLFYKPRKAVIKQDKFTYWSLDELPPYLSRISYVKKIDHERVGYDKMSDTYYTGYYEPLKRLKEAVKLNSFYSGISLTYQFGLK